MPGGRAGRRQAPLRAARGAACLPGASPRRQGGVTLLWDLLVTRGSPLAQRAEVRRFSGGSGAWVSSRHPHGVRNLGFEWHRSCWKPSGLLDRGSWGPPSGDLLPHQPGLFCRPFPLLPSHPWPRQLSRAGRDGGIQVHVSQPPSDGSFFPH